MTFVLVLFGIWEVCGEVKGRNVGKVGTAGCLYILSPAVGIGNDASMSSPPGLASSADPCI